VRKGAREGEKGRERGPKELRKVSKSLLNLSQKLDKNQSVSSTRRTETKQISRVSRGVNSRKASCLSHSRYGSLS